MLCVKGKGKGKTLPNPYLVIIINFATRQHSGFFIDTGSSSLELLKCLFYTSLGAQLLGGVAINDLVSLNLLVIFDT